MALSSSGVMCEVQGMGAKLATGSVDRFSNFGGKSRASGCGDRDVECVGDRRTTSARKVEMGPHTAAGTQTRARHHFERSS